MALRRVLLLDTSMAQPGLDTDATWSRSGRCCKPHDAARSASMASSRPTSTGIQPSAPDKDQPAPTISPSDAPTIALPKSLAQTLQFLSDDDLETLRVAVDCELERRRPTG